MDAVVAVFWLIEFIITQAMRYLTLITVWALGDNFIGKLFVYLNLAKQSNGGADASAVKPPGGGTTRRRT
jgi:hypothetical protein